VSEGKEEGEKNEKGTMGQFGELHEGNKEAKVGFPRRN